MSQGAPYVGAAAGASDAASVEPLRVDEYKLKPKMIGHILNHLNDEQIQKLETYLTSRLAAGVVARDRRLTRYGKIDKLISTWQKLNGDDSKRELIEDNTGRQQALPMNLPILYSSLNDMVSYFTEALAPISNPFYTASGDEKATELIAKFNRDAKRRNYYTNLALTIRSLLKYNLGGFRLGWEDGIERNRQVTNQGNDFRTLDLYNTLWDPSIRKPPELAAKGEWAATVSLENRTQLLKKAIAGEWARLEDILCGAYTGQSQSRYYKEPAIVGGIDAEDSKTSSSSKSVDWSSYGIGLAGDLGPEVAGFEVVDMVIELIPCQFGLLTKSEEDEINAAEGDSDLFLEKWQFVLIDNRVVHAEPLIPRKMTLEGEPSELPFYMSFLTQDQLDEAQRSFIELQKGFQRFGSAMYNIYIEGMRKNVWGLKVYDPTAIDPSQLKPGQTTGNIPSKQQGRDVRSAITDVSTNAGVDGTLQGVNESLQLRDRFFPAQSLPNQVAGIDRAVKSQVTQVVQGTTRSMRSILRQLDETLLAPMRLGAYRNLKMFDKDGIETITDEDIAKLLGSGIESIESERVSDLLWQLLYAIIQNAEAMQVFDIPKIFAYLGRIGNLSVDLGTFVKAPQAMPQQDPGAGVAPGTMPPDGMPVQ